MRIINIAVLVSAVILTGCGGGGGVTNDVKTVVQTPTGTKDTSFDVTIPRSTTTTYGGGVTAFNRRIQGSIPGKSITVPNPPLDVRAVWSEGWTGSGVNILIMDDFRAFGLSGTHSSADDPRGVHGYTVGMLAKQIAPRATFYGLEASILVGGVKEGDMYAAIPTYGLGGLRLAGEATNEEIIGAAIPTIHVVNMSFGKEPVTLPITEDELRDKFRRVTHDPRFRDVAGILGTPLSDALKDAVITKSAGNDKVDSLLVISNVRLISTLPSNPSECASTGVCVNTRNRALIVGALDKFARVVKGISSDAKIAGYSNVAGAFAGMQARFLVEYGGAPYSPSGAYLCMKSPSASCRNRQRLPGSDVGTSYAAPRVAGFAALVRDKFPTLSGATTATILLKTATTRGLACHNTDVGCPKNIYGQGRVDIAKALSPIGGMD